MSTSDIQQYIEAGAESRHIEYKRSFSWDDVPIRTKIIKTILGMSNTKDGGSIIIGMEEQPDNSYLPQGIQADHLSSFQDTDTIKEHASKYADPYAIFNVTIEKHNGVNFVLINVTEFDELPVICKNEHTGILRRGAIYVRSKRGKPETIEVPTEVEMREIIEMAVDKANIKLSKRGYQIAGKTSDEQLYNLEIKDWADAK
jgi:hypothetical protein